MFFKLKSVFYHFVRLLIFTYSVVSSDEIPTMLWNIKGNAMHIKPVSALGSNDKIFVEILNDTIHQQNSSSCIVVFAVNKLSLEDFSASENTKWNNTLHNMETFLDLQQHMLLPSVKDPLNHIHKAHCGVQEIVVNNKIDESIMQLVSSAIEKSCVVILHISDDGIVESKDKLKSVLSPSFENSNKNIVGIFTAGKSSWGSSNSDRHVFRNLLATAPSEDNFVNFTGCIIMYAENATIKIGKKSNVSVSLAIPSVTLDGSSCSNSSILQLNFKTSGALSTVTIKLNFAKTRGAWKTSGSVSMTGEKALADEISLSTESIEAPIGFSYSCGDLEMRAKNSSIDVTIKMNNFQIQPFQVREVFSESFDCVPFFTIPIWMGIFVSLLFIAIANIGIYALFSVHTMDRFDDPKGKTISVATTD